MRRYSPRLVAIIAIFTAGLTASPAAAQLYPTRALEDRDATITAIFENDWFARTDRNYTNGLRLAWLSGTKRPNGIAGHLANFVTGEDENALLREGWAVGHEIYTPADVDTPAPLPTQHPYAGYLYGEYSALLEQADTVDQLSLRVGVVGPSAGGETIQNGYHSLIGGEEADGWDNQIDDTLALTLSYDRQVRNLFDSGIDGLEADLTPSFGASLGTVHTNIRAGLTARLGSDLRNDYGPPLSRPSRAGAGFFTPSDGFDWYVFAGLEARAVAHNIFLDGSPFRDDDPQVKSHTFNGDIQAGLVTQFGRTQIAYTYVYRTEQFKGQNDPQIFGAVSASFKY